MPLGIKNIGDTYQRAMTTTFHDIIHKILESYVNDLLDKSLLCSDHPKDFCTI